MFFKNRLASFVAVSAIGAVSLFSQSVYAQENLNVCNAQNLSGLMDADVANFEKKELDIALGSNLNGAEINAYYEGETLKVITAFFQGAGGMAEMNFYFMADKEHDHLMEYRNTQFSNYLDEEDSVVLTDETSYYHVCAGELLTPAFNGIIDDDTYQNMKAMLNLILTEESAQ